jgi:Ca2+-binding RTX toxin-like protein
VIVENTNQGTDTVVTYIDLTLGSNLENLTLGGSGSISGVGNGLNNVLVGNSGDNSLDGGLGADTMRGGSGNDTYQVDNASDVVIEGIDEGNDTVISTVSYALQANVENLTLSGISNIDGTGNALANVLAGNIGVNTLTGGDGNDTYIADQATDVLVETSGQGTDSVISSISWTLGDHFENLTLSGATAISGTGNSLSNVLLGNSGANSLYGESGSDFLDGGAGADTMVGGADDDTFVVDDALDSAVEVAAEDGIDTVMSSVSFVLGAHVENLTLTGPANISGTGNGLDNILTGNSGNNELNGGLGNDRYHFGNSSGQDVITDVDLTPGNIDTLVLGAGITPIDVSVTRDQTHLAVSINGSADTVSILWAPEAGAAIEFVQFADGTSWDAAQLEQAASEAGMLRGGAGGDTLSGGVNTTVVEGRDGDDIITDTTGNNLLNGGAGNDQITAGAGNDMLVGGTGNDTIYTGGGSDVIAFNAGDGIDSVFSAAGASNTLSFGGGIGYDDLSLSKEGSDLIVSAGENDRVVLKDWYAGANSVLNLQIILDATDEFNASSSDPLYNKKVQTFDFLGMVSAFDAELQQGPGLTSWAMTNALLAFHLSGADDAAIGGDLAYWYGKNNGFTGISLQAAQEAIGAAGFGSDAQTLRPFAGLQEGLVKLS